MRNNLFTIVIYIFCFLSFKANGQKPIFKAVTANTASVKKFEKFELSVNLAAAFTNPYNYKDIAVQGIFIAPDGRKDTVDGFYSQDYILDTVTGSLSPAGTGNFKIRFSPNETGTWKYILTCTNTKGTAIQPVQSFQCTASAAPGFVRKNNTNYLNFDDGTQYIPIGENLAWQNKEVYASYHSWISKLSANKANFIRVWLAHWGLGIEWKKGVNGFEGLEQYKQSSAYYLDWLLDLCNQKGIYVMFCINHHGQVSSKVDPNWKDNPYNAVNGGPCKNTWDFFTDTTAREDHKNRLRYILARWGYSKNIMSWELFNEVEWTDNFNEHKEEIKDWHAEMATYLKTNDVYHHLVTTSYAHDKWDSTTWKLPDIDFTQTHYYVGSPNLEAVLSAGSQAYLSQFHKPTLNGEFGLAAGNINLRAVDPNGIYIHNGLWGSLLGGGMGSAMSWWWDNYIDPQNLYRHFKPLSNFVARLKLKEDNYKKVPASIKENPSASDSLQLSAYVLGPADSTKIAGWVLNKQYNWKYWQEHNGTPPPAITESHLLVPAVKNGTYKIQLYDCTDGSLLKTFTATAKNNELVIKLPTINWDLSFVAFRQGVKIK